MATQNHSAIREATLEELSEYIGAMLPRLIQNAREYGCFPNEELYAEMGLYMEDFGMDITFATNDAGDTFAVQTGDNSYSGPAYFYPHWAVTTILPDTTAHDLYEEVVRQWDDLLSQ